MLGMFYNLLATNKTKKQTAVPHFTVTCSILFRRKMFLKILAHVVPVRIDVHVGAVQSASVASIIGAASGPARSPFVFAITGKRQGYIDVLIRENDDENQLDGQAVDGYNFAVGAAKATVAAVSRCHKPMVDSGSFVSTCHAGYDPSTPTVDANYKLNLESVLCEKLTHYGYKGGA